MNPNNIFLLLSVSSCTWSYMIIPTKRASILMSSKLQLAKDNEEKETLNDIQKCYEIASVEDAEWFREFVSSIRTSTPTTTTSTINEKKSQNALKKLMKNNNLDLDKPQILPKSEEVEFKDQDFKHNLESENQIRSQATNCEEVESPRGEDEILQQNTRLRLNEEISEEDIFQATLSEEKENWNKLNSFLKILEEQRLEEEKEEKEEKKKEINEFQNQERNLSRNEKKHHRTMNQKSSSRRSEKDTRYDTPPRRYRQRSQVNPQYKPNPEQRQRQRTKRTPEYNDENETSQFWPDLNSFEENLRREAQMRLLLLGPKYKALVKQESQWRWKLYKSWLGVLEKGVSFDDWLDEYDNDERRYKQDLSNNRRNTADNATPKRRRREPFSNHNEEQSVFSKSKRRNVQRYDRIIENNNDDNDDDDDDDDDDDEQLWNYIQEQRRILAAKRRQDSKQKIYSHNNPQQENIDNNNSLRRNETVTNTDIAIE